MTGSFMTISSTIDRKRTAFEILVREHHVRLISYAQALVKDRALAEDLVQDSFIIAYRKFDRYDASRDFAAWMRGIIRFKYLEHQRARAVSALDPATLEGIDGLHETWDRIDEQSGDDRLVTLRTCLDRLSGLVRSSLEAFYFGERSCADIAAASGTSEEVVRKRLQRGREFLHLCITGHGVQPAAGTRP